MAGTGGALAGGGVSAAIPTFIGVYGLACTCASVNQLQEIKQDSKKNNFFFCPKNKHNFPKVHYKNLYHAETKLLKTTE